MTVIREFGQWFKAELATLREEIEAYEDSFVEVVTRSSAKTVTNVS